MEKGLYRMERFLLKRGEARQRIKRKIRRELNKNFIVCLQLYFSVNS